MRSSKTSQESASISKIPKTHESANSDISLEKLKNYKQVNNTHILYLEALYIIFIAANVQICGIKEQYSCFWSTLSACWTTTALLQPPVNTNQEQ